MFSSFHFGNFISNFLNFWIFSNFFLNLFEVFFQFL